MKPQKWSDCSKCGHDYDLHFYHSGQHYCIADDTAKTKGHRCKCVGVIPTYEYYSRDVLGNPL